MDSIIFDVDGTLWDSSESVTHSWNLAFKENTDLNITVEKEFLQSLFGKPMNELLYAVIPQVSEEERERLAPILYKYVNEGLLSWPGILYDGVKETLKLLSSKYPLYIVSNCQCGYIESFLQSTNTGSYFSGHLCFGNTNAPKDVTMKELVKQYHLKSPVYVGDTMGDFISCQKAGIPFILAEYGFGNVPEAPHRIQSMYDLPGRLNF